jgi:putative hemin transport protein
MTGNTTEALFAGWQAARAHGLNNRAAAAQAGVSEAELLASGCGRGVTRLAGDFAGLLAALPALGELKSVIRNACAVQERTGRVVAAAGDGRGTRVQGDTFLLQAATERWARGFALTEPGKYGIKRSLQFFTARGTSAGKFFLTPASDEAGYAALVQRHAAADQSDRETVDPAAPALPGPPAPSVAGSLAGFLFEASRLGLPVEIEVANEAAVQVSVKRLEHIKRSDRGGWINVLDPGLDLHLHEARIVSVQALERGSGGLLRWFADDGSEALATGFEAHGEALVRAATA